MKNHERPTKKFSQKRYITLTKDDTVKVLDLYNAINNMLNDVGETLDVDLSALRDIRHKNNDIDHLFNFRAKVQDNGDVWAWADSVLPDDDKAYYYHETG
tara:strand:+ start:3367 stop:3666 length:300 start_codon:yes stop_codon:yes gene_type:complete